MTSSTSQPSAPQALGQRLGGDVGSRQEDPVDRIENVVVRRELRGQTSGRLLALWHQVRLDSPSLQGMRGHLADRRHLQTGEGPSVQPVLLELLPYGPTALTEVKATHS